MLASVGVLPSMAGSSEGSQLPATETRLEGIEKQMPPSQIHILLVDDERLSRVVVSNLLRKCKYRGMNLDIMCFPLQIGFLIVNHTQVHHVVAVTCAESGAEAIDLLTRSDYRSFHLILTVRSTYLCSRRGFCFSLSGISGVSGDWMPRFDLRACASCSLWLS